MFSEIGGRQRADRYIPAHMRILHPVNLCLDALTVPCGGHFSSYTEVVITKQNTAMQDYETTVEDSQDDGINEDRLANARIMSRLVAKRALMAILFGPGVLGFLWLIGKLLKR